MDPLLRPNQNRFRPGRSTTSHILALRRIIDGVKSHSLQAATIFVDFKKAFDSIHRHKMLKILRKYGVPRKLVDAIGKLYESTFASVLSPDDETDLFQIQAGILPGGTLAPFLFVFTVDYAMRQAIDGHVEQIGFEITPRKSQRHPTIKVADMLFADDVALLSEEIDQAQKLLSKVQTEAAKIGLHLNAKKTEFMAYKKPDDITIKTKSGELLRKVQNCKYLGGWVASSEQDFGIRKALAWSACNKMKKIWKSNMNRTIKVRLFRATVESVLLYNSETWFINKNMQKRVDGCYTRMLRMTTNTSWKEKTTNEVLYQDLQPPSQTISERRMILAAHCIRHTNEMAHKLILWEPTRGKRNSGRQPVTYIDCLKEDTGHWTHKHRRNKECYDGKR